MLLSDEDLPLQHIHDQNLGYRQDCQCNSSKRINWGEASELFILARRKHQLGVAGLQISFVKDKERTFTSSRYNPEFSITNRLLGSFHSVFHQRTPGVCIMRLGVMSLPLATNSLVSFRI